MSESGTPEAILSERAFRDALLGWNPDHASRVRRSHEALRVERDGLVTQLRETEAEVERLTAERDTLRRTRTGTALDRNVWQDRAEAAEARVAALETERDAAEDFRAEIVVDAFTAPDADWDTILDSLRARITALGTERDECREHFHDAVRRAVERCDVCGGRMFQGIHESEFAECVIRAVEGDE